MSIKPHSFFITFIISSIILFFVTNLFIIGSINKIEIKGKLYVEKPLQIFYLNKLLYKQFGDDGFVSHHSVITISNGDSESPVSKTTAYTNNRLIDRLKLGFSVDSPEIKIDELILYSFFSDTKIITGSQLYANISKTNDVKISKLNDSLVVETTGDEPWVVLDSPINNTNILVQYFFPFIFALFFTLLLSSIRWSNIPAFHDINNRETRHGSSYSALDGVRGFAALFVLLEHTNRTFLGLGALGVIFFFVLSGFLLSIPFIYKGKDALKFNFLSDYFARRIKRIVPLYYLVICALFFFKGDVNKSIRHFLFVQADGYLWTIPQEMAFYLFLPFILAIAILVLRNQGVRVVVFTFIAAFLCHYLITKDVISIYGLGTNMNILLSLFLFGVMGSYFYHKVYLTSESGVAFVQRNQNKIATVLLLMLMITCLLSLSMTGKDTNKLLVFQYREFFGLICAVIIVGLLMVKDSFFYKLINFKPLCAVGIVGYSIYLLHPFILEIVKVIEIDFLDANAHFVIRFTITLLLTYAFSVFTYSYIEKPFMLNKKMPS